MSDAWQLNALVLIGSLMIALLSGVWIPVALGLVGLMFLYLDGGTDGLESVGSLVFNNVNSMTLTAIPMFVLMGELIMQSTLMQSFYRSLSIWLRWLPGSLLHSQIAASSVMGAVSGSSVATAGAIGSASIPTLKEQGYERRRIYGALAAGGTLGILIPPSIIMVVYGALTQVSVSKLYTAALIPGVVLTLLFMSYVLVQEFTGHRSPKPPPTPWSEKLGSLKELLPVIGLLAATIGAIYAGVVTPTEAGGLGSLATLALLAGYRQLTWDVVKKALLGTIHLSGMVLAIVMGASIYSYALVRGDINRGVSEAIANSGLGKTGVLLLTALLILALGMFIDGISIVYLALPVLVPVMVSLDVDLIWFGVFVTILIEVGLIHPPLGLNLFVIKSIDPTATITEVAIGAVPYILLMFGLLAILMAWPEVALFPVDQGPSR